MNTLEKAEAPGSYKLNRNAAGLTQNEVAVLQAYIPPSFSVVAEKLGSSKQRIGQIAKKLREQGYLEKNGTMLTITEEGRKAAMAKKEVK